jgi:NAD(P)H-flavin reductase
MANAPHESDAVTLHVRHVPGGAFSARVPQLKPGDTLEIELPFGAFSLQEEQARPVLFVAGGTGFAPVKSILDDMLKRRIDRPVTLIWGGAAGRGHLPARGRGALAEAMAADALHRGAERRR